MEIVALNAVICFQKIEENAPFAGGTKVLTSTSILSSWKTIYPIMIRAKYVQINDPAFSRLRFSFLSWFFMSQK